MKLSHNLISSPSIKLTQPPLYKKLKLKFIGFLKNHLKITQYNVQHKNHYHSRVLGAKHLHIFSTSQKSNIEEIYGICRIASRVINYFLSNRFLDITNKRHSRNNKMKMSLENSRTAGF